MKRKPKDPAEELNAQIEQEYYKQAVNRRISVMKINPFFTACRSAMLLDGQTAKQAVAAHLNTFCEPART